MSRFITTDNKDEAKQLFNALNDDACVVTPLEEMSFSPAFAMLKDKFGVTFTIISEKT